MLKLDLKMKIFGESVMAIIDCPECGKEVSDKADKCPECGNPYPRKKYVYSSLGAKIFYGYFMTTVVIIAILAVGYYLNYTFLGLFFD